METNIQSNNEQSPSSQPEFSSPNAGSAPPSAGSKKMSTELIIGVVVLVIVIIGAIAAYAFFVSYFSQPQSEESATSPTPSPSTQVVEQLPTDKEDSTASIDQQINDTTIQDADSQFKDIDADLNQL